MPYFSRVTELIATDEFASWYGELDDTASDDVDAVVGLLEARGVLLGFPQSSAINGASFALRECACNPVGSRCAYSTPSIRRARRCF